MALSLAHRRSRHARIDPCYSASRLLPTPDRAAGPAWLYLPGALEAWRMVLVRANGFRDATGPFQPGALFGSIASLRLLSTPKRCGPVPGRS